MINQHALTNQPTRRVKNGVRIKTIALPAEHGGWGFLLEPIVLGLLLAPSIAGFYLALSAVALFLARQPLMLLVLNRKRESPRTAIARRFSMLYVIVGVAALSAALIFSKHSFIAPLAIAAPFAAMQLISDWSGRKRLLSAEIAGAVAVCSLATALALAGGWPRTASFALWAIMIGRSVPAIVYVRSCLMRLHGRTASSLPMLIIHGIALVAVLTLARFGLAPKLAVAAMMVLVIRAVVGFYKLRVTPKQLGFSEIAFGAATVLAVAFGNFFAW
jgi:YwiC-like protein